ncbi:MAG: succinate dehydrogenase, hydrophobic membrane anchor protein [Gammaproteobacteria bacterium]
MIIHKDGVAAWWLERVTALALVPLTLWLAASLIALSVSDHTRFVRWVSTPLTTLLIVLLLIALFTHLALGLQVVIEDYLHSWARIPVLLTARFACILLCVAGIMATLFIAFTH